MKIGFIGAGKVGCSLGRYFDQQHQIIGYFSKSFESAEAAAALTGAAAFHDALALCEQCDTIFITTPDGQIEPTAILLAKAPEAPAALNGKNLCHCSGALPSSALSACKDAGAFTYSVHPLFAVSSKETSLEELASTFFTIEGSAEHMESMKRLIQNMGNRCQEISAESKTRYHAAAALASNHVVALYRLASNELVRCGFTQQDAEAALGPLFLGNATHIAHDGVLAALTGPAERGDFKTIDKHLACLDGDTREVYRLLNKELLQLAAEKHSNER